MEIKDTYTRAEIIEYLQRQKEAAIKLQARASKPQIIQKFKTHKNVYDALLIAFGEDNALKEYIKACEEDGIEEAEEPYIF